MASCEKGGNQDAARSPGQNSGEDDSGSDDGGGFITGGGCSYDRYDGTCTITSVPESSFALFKYEGDSPGGNVSADGNEIVLNAVVSSIPSDVDRSYAAQLNLLDIKSGNKYPCQLACIKTGTCTPSSITFENLKNEYYKASGQTAMAEDDPCF